MQKTRLFSLSNEFLAFSIDCTLKLAFVLHERERERERRVTTKPRNCAKLLGECRAMIKGKNVYYVKDLHMGVARRDYIPTRRVSAVFQRAKPWTLADS